MQDRKLGDWTRLGASGKGEQPRTGNEEHQANPKNPKGVEGRSLGKRR